jgi:hypothetical protein
MNGEGKQNNTMNFTQAVFALNSACFVMKAVTQVMATGIVKLVVLYVLHSSAYYGIIFWGDSTDSTKVCNNQIKIFSLMVGIKTEVSYREL